MQGVGRKLYLAIIVGIMRLERVKKIEDVILLIAHNIYTGFRGKTSLLWA